MYNPHLGLFLLISFAHDSTQKSNKNNQCLLCLISVGNYCFL